MTWQEELTAELDAGVRAELMGTLPEFVRGHRMATLGTKVDGEYVNEAVPVDRLEDAQVVTSWTGDREDPPNVPVNSMDWSALATMPETFHRPVLDIDIPMAIIPSSTPGHGHLYLDKVMTWTQYAKLLDVLAEVGIIEPGYRDASHAREFTSVRLPWVRKPAQEETVLEAHIESLCSGGVVMCQECYAAAGS